jgi:hypothetical protein
VRLSAVKKQTGRVKKRFDSNQATDLSLPLPQASNTAAESSVCAASRVQKAVHELTYIKAVSGGGVYVLPYTIGELQ